MSVKSKSAVIAAIQNHDCVKAVSLVDLMGDSLDMFVIRAVLALSEGSNVKLLLEAYLMEQFASVLYLTKQSIDTDCSGQIGLIGEVIIFCNVFLNTDISCDRLLQRAISVLKFSDSNASLVPQRRVSVKFASSVIGGSSSSSASATAGTGTTRFEHENFWNIFSSVLDIYGQTRSFLQRLVEHILVNLRGYVQDYSQYQQFAGQLMSILRALRGDQHVDQCDCPKYAIPVFLSACVSEQKSQNAGPPKSHCSSLDSSASSGSQLSEIYGTEQVQEFWSTLRKDPLGLYAIFIDRLRFVADLLLGDTNRKVPVPSHVPCFCQCHTKEWRSHLITRVLSTRNSHLAQSGMDQRPDFDIQHLLKLLTSQMANIVNKPQKDEACRLGLTVEEILQNVQLRGPESKRPITMGARLPANDADPIVSSEVPNASTRYGLARAGPARTSFDLLEDTDQSTSVWSAATIRLPLQPDTNVLLGPATRRFRDDDSESSSDLEAVHRRELQERKDRFNQEVLALQKHFLRSPSISSSYAATNTDSDVESLPFESPAYLDDKRLLATKPAVVNLKPKGAVKSGVDQATSPHGAEASPQRRLIVSMDRACQTGVHFGHAAMQTDSVRLKDATVLTETPVMQTEVQTDPSYLPTLGGLISRKQDNFLHVQDMTKRDVQQIFRSAQAFANIC